MPGRRSARARGGGRASKAARGVDAEVRMRAPLMQWDPVRPASLVLQREGVELLRGLKKGVPVVAATMTGAMRSGKSTFLCMLTEVLEGKPTDFAGLKERGLAFAAGAQIEGLTKGLDMVVVPITMPAEGEAGPQEAYVALLDAEGQNDQGAVQDFKLAVSAYSLASVFMFNSRASFGPQGLVGKLQSVLVAGEALRAEGMTKRFVFVQRDADELWSSEALTARLFGEERSGPFDAAFQQCSAVATMHPRVPGGPESLRALAELVAEDIKRQVAGTTVDGPQLAKIAEAISEHVESEGFGPESHQLQTLRARIVSLQESTTPTDYCAISGKLAWWDPVEVKMPVGWLGPSFVHRFPTNPRDVKDGLVGVVVEREAFIDRRSAADAAGEDLPAEVATAQVARDLFLGPALTGNRDSLRRKIMSNWDLYRSNGLPFFSHVTHEAFLSAVRTGSPVVEGVRHWASAVHRAAGGEEGRDATVSELIAMDSRHVFAYRRALCHPYDPLPKSLAPDRPGSAARASASPGEGGGASAAAAAAAAAAGPGAAAAAAPGPPLPAEPPCLFTAAVGTIDPSVTMWAVALLQQSWSGVLRAAGVDTSLGRSLLVADCAAKGLTAKPPCRKWVEADKSGDLRSLLAIACARCVNPLGRTPVPKFAADSLARAEASGLVSRKLTGTIIQEAMQAAQGAAGAASAAGAGGAGAGGAGASAGAGADGAGADGAGADGAGADGAGHLTLRHVVTCLQALRIAGAPLGTPGRMSLPVAVRNRASQADLAPLCMLAAVSFGIAGVSAVAAVLGVEPLKERAWSPLVVERSLAAAGAAGAAAALPAAGTWTGLTCKALEGVGDGPGLRSDCLITGATIAHALAIVGVDIADHFEVFADRTLDGRAPPGARADSSAGPPSKAQLSGALVAACGKSDMEWLRGEWDTHLNPGHLRASCRDVAGIEEAMAGLPWLALAADFRGLVPAEFWPVVAEVHGANGNAQNDGYGAAVGGTCDSPDDDDIDDEDDGFGAGAAALGRPVVFGAAAHEPGSHEAGPAARPRPNALPPRCLDVVTAFVAMADLWFWSSASTRRQLAKAARRAAASKRLSPLLEVGAVMARETAGERLEPFLRAVGVVPDASRWGPDQASAALRQGHFSVIFDEIRGLEHAADGLTVAAAAAAAEASAAQHATLEEQANARGALPPRRGLGAELEQAAEQMRCDATRLRQVLAASDAGAKAPGLAPGRALKDQARRAIILGEGFCRMRAGQSWNPEPREAGFNMPIMSVEAVSVLEHHSHETAPVGVSLPEIVFGVAHDGDATDVPTARAIEGAVWLREWRCAQGCVLGPLSLAALLDHVRDSPTMAALGISGRFVNGQSKDRLADALRTCESLSSLSIVDGSWRLREAPTCVFEALQTHPSITALTLEGCNIWRTGFESLGAAIASPHSKLARLRLGLMQTGLVRAEGLLAAASQRPSLVSLEMDCSTVSADAEGEALAEALDAAMVSNTALRSVTLALNIPQAEGAKTDAALRRVAAKHGCSLAVTWKRAEAV
ncbi:hypothetical protein FNF27_06415 [Cafeteria roenbergensis]|uniref:Guanylate-binding protein N-terminal domain-containing protein n=1 Tax=Cafeteria roenbergensis TaxID=33653 RepID=A0A5A8E577_CAFRO|nr:hypothetical protein FNF27_06415 [Cafeteria roenbergensis]